MTKVILGLVVLVALTLIAVPALAAKPQPLHQVKWGGSGVTMDLMGQSVVGDNVQFDIQAETFDGLTWTGEGSFEDKDWSGGKLKANLGVDTCLNFDLDPPLVVLEGVADISIGEDKVGPTHFSLLIDQDPAGDPEFGIIFGEYPNLLVWIIYGVDAIKGKPMTLL